MNYKDPPLTVQPANQPANNHQITEIEFFGNCDNRAENSVSPSCNLQDQKLFFRFTELLVAKGTQRTVQSTLSPRCLAVVCTGIAALVSVIAASSIGIFTTVLALVIIALSPW